LSANIKNVPQLALKRAAWATAGYGWWPVAFHQEHLQATIEILGIAAVDSWWHSSSSKERLASAGERMDTAADIWLIATADQNAATATQNVATANQNAATADQNTIHS